MSEARPWLPPDTCFGRVDRKIAGIVREWSRAWFGDDDVEVAPGASPGDAALRAAKPRPCAAGTWLLVQDGAAAAIARSALQIDPGLRATQADETVLDAIGQACLAALGDALARELGLDAASGIAVDSVFGLGPVTRWEIHCERMPTRLGLAIREVERIELLLRLLPSPSPRPGLPSLDLALASLEVELGADLGTCGITLAELGSLSSGDVLVLDRDLSAALPLAIDGAPARGGTCKVSRQADNLLLEISEPLSGRIT